MTKPPTPAAAPRQVLSVDLGPLRPRLDAAATADGMKPSSWLKRALRDALDAFDGGPAPDAALTAAGRMRVLLSAGAVRQLDERCKAEGFRSRDDALLALLGGAMGQRAAMAPASQSGKAKRQAEGVGVAAAGAALITSNVELVAIGRTLQLIAKSISAGGDAARLSAEILEAVRLVRLHVKNASTAAAEISSLVRIQSEARK